MPFTLPHDHGNPENIEKLYKELSESGNFLPVSNLFKILSDSSRLKILWLLSHREECVINISALIGISSPAVSHHLSILTEAKLIESNRRGKEVYYKVSDGEICRLIHTMTEEMMEITCPSEKEPGSKTPEEIIKDVHEYLISHLDERITIESLSRKFLINRTTMKKTFKEIYGTSLASHMNSHRMEKAAKLLAEGGSGIAEIAASVGFTSQSRFTEAFKKYFGLSPKDYRKGN